ncbi:MAG: LysE family translocator [Prevotellaceae bacterium]|jgi:threonine/homoserine/homoserine lactone efflux protein|nr:LysE family translocator [Prevotellaceae bacterium]
MDILFLLIKGFFVGLLASVPLGPAGVLCIQRTLNRGRRAGFFSGMGVALADTLFAAVAVLSLSVVEEWIADKENGLQLLVGVVVVAVGVKIMLTNPVKQLRARGKQQQGSLGGALISLFFLTINPINLLPVLFLVGLFKVSVSSVWHTIIVLLGVLAGALAWWLFLSTLVSHYRKRFKLRQMWWINKASGAVILLLGSLAFIDGAVKVVKTLLAQAG